ALDTSFPSSSHSTPPPPTQRGTQSQRNADQDSRPAPRRSARQPCNPFPLFLLSSDRGPQMGTPVLRHSGSSFCKYHQIIKTEGVTSVMSTAWSNLSRLNVLPSNQSSTISFSLKNILGSPGGTSAGRLPYLKRESVVGGQVSVRWPLVYGTKFLSS
ncbi:hypothetical protein Fcan01_22428, partial [Folsomia candida]